MYQKYLKIKRKVRTIFGILILLPLKAAEENTGNAFWFYFTYCYLSLGSIHRLYVNKTFNIAIFNRFFLANKALFHEAAI